MKIFAFIAAVLILMSFDWNTDFAKAQQQAKDENKLVFLYFSGSDWCRPCMKMRKSILDDSAFMNYASKNLILVNADFPQRSKLSKEQVAQNEALAEKYNKKGTFPMSLLIGHDGKVIVAWAGLYEGKPKEFVNELVKYQKPSPKDSNAIQTR